MAETQSIDLPTMPHRRPSMFDFDAVEKHTCEGLHTLFEPGSIESGSVPLRYENTYRMGPKNYFLPDKVRTIIEETLSSHLEGFNYEPSSSAALTKRMSAEILQKVKKLDFDRYRFISNVTIGQKNEQGLIASSRVLWDSKVDNYAEGTFQNNSLFAQGTVFAIYKE